MENTSEQKVSFRLLIVSVSLTISDRKLVHALTKLHSSRNLLKAHGKLKLVIHFVNSSVGNVSSMTDINYHEHALDIITKKFKS